MATIKTRAERKRSLIINIGICVLLVTAIILTAISFMKNRSTLFSDQIFARTFAEAIGKSPSALTEEDIQAIKVLGISTQTDSQTNQTTTMLIVGGDDLVTALEVDIEAEGYDQEKHSEQFTAAQKIANFSATLKKIDDVAKFKNLVHLDLSGQLLLKNLNIVQDLKNLETLMIGKTGIKSIKDLSNLTALKELNVQSLGLVDISVLSKLTALEKLYLSNNKISDLAPISELTSLETLYIEGNEIDGGETAETSTDESGAAVKKSPLSLKELKNLKALKELFLTANKVMDAEVIADFKELKKLSLASTGFDDLDLIIDLAKLETLILSDNKIDDISMLSGLIKLKEIDFSKNEIKDISVLSKMVNLKTVYIGENKIDDVTALKDLKNMEVLYLNDNSITDVSSLANYDAEKIRIIYLTGNKIIDGEKLQEKYKNTYVIFDPDTTSGTSETTSGDTSSDESAAESLADTSATVSE